MTPYETYGNIAQQMITLNEITGLEVQFSGSTSGPCSIAMPEQGVRHSFPNAAEALAILNTLTQTPSEAEASCKEMARTNLEEQRDKIDEKLDAL